MKVMFIADVPDNTDVKRIALTGTLYEDYPNGWEVEYFDRPLPVPIPDGIEVEQKQGIWRFAIKGEKE